MFVAVCGVLTRCRYKEEMRRLEERLSTAERHCHELERTIDNGRDEMARAIEKHTHEMKDMEERLARCLPALSLLLPAALKD